MTARLQTPEGYRLTVLTALKAVEKVNQFRIPAGFHTPATAFGHDFITEIEGVKREGPFRQ